MKAEAAKVALAAFLYWVLDPTLALLIVVIIYHVASNREHQSNFKKLTAQIQRLEKLCTQAAKQQPPKRQPSQQVASKNSRSEVTLRKSFARQLSLVQIEVDEDEHENEEMVFGSAPAPEFPFLVMDTSSYHQQEVYPNWRATIPIENDLFVGACVLKIKTDPQDEVYRPYFDGKRRLMELQLQGKFKQLPKGPLYMGIETPPPGVHMGFMTKSIANIILGLLKKMLPESHHSFGSKAECPHIVFPLTSTMDTFIVTPEGEEPPLLGVAGFPPSHDKEDPNLRDLKVGPTYSLSFHSMYLNLATWKVANLPGGLKDVSMSSFFGDRPLRMVAYDMGGEADTHKPHLTKNKRYFFCFEMSWAGGEVEWPLEETRPPPRRPGKAKKAPKAAPKEASKGIPTDDFVNSGKGKQNEASPGSFGFSSSPPPTRGASVLSMSMSTGAPQVEKLSEITDLTIPAHVKYGGQLYFVFQFTISKREEGRKEEGEEGGGSEIAGKKTKVTFSVLRTPEEIRSFARLIKVRRLKVYNKNLRKRSNHTVNKKRMEVCCRMREALGLEAIPNKFLSPRGDSSSDDEDSDRESEISDLKSPDSVAECFDLFMKESENDTCLLSPSPWIKQGFEGTRIVDGADAGEDLMSGGSFSGVLIRATSETEWIVNWAILTSQSLKFFDQSSKRTPKMALLLTDIVAVFSITGKADGVGDTLVPFAGYHFFRVETVLRVNYLCVRSKEECDQWVRLLSGLEGIRKSFEPPIDGEELDTSGGMPARPSSPDNENPPMFLAEHQKHQDLYAFPSAPAGSVAKLKKQRKSARSPSLRKMFYRQVGKRKVLNGKRLSFADPDEKLQSPLQLSENLLAAVMNLSSTSTTQQFAEFADTTNYLKTVLLSPLSNLEKIAFFLNVFHTLLLHALLVLGPPSANVKKWKSFFHKISYECAGHILSLSEIEQNILRSKGAKPKLLWSFIPKWGREDSRKTLSITSFDPRVNILLNYGSTTCPPFIAKFSPGTPSQLEQQLEEAVARNLDFQVRVDIKKKQISLPKMMYWYQNDYGSSVSNTVAWAFEHASPTLREQFLALDVTGRFTKAGVVVKFRNYHYNFQHQFQKMDLGDGNDSDEVSDDDEEVDDGKGVIDDDDGDEESIYQEIGTE